MGDELKTPLPILTGPVVLSGLGGRDDENDRRRHANYYYHHDQHQQQQYHHGDDNNGGDGDYYPPNMLSPVAAIAVVPSLLANSSTVSIKDDCPEGMVPAMMLLSVVTVFIIYLLAFSVSSQS